MSTKHQELAPDYRFTGKLRTNRKLYKTIHNCRQIETDWLNAIDAPCDSIPSEVADAIAVRTLLEKLPIDVVRAIYDDIAFGKLINFLK